MTDRTTKALLLAIALGLWANLATTWLRPTPLQAQTATAGLPLADSTALLREIATNTKFMSIDTGTMSVSLQAIARDNALKRR